MKHLLCLTVILAISTAKVEHPCHIREKRLTENIREPLPMIEDVPDNWDWSCVNDTNFLTITR